MVYPTLLTTLARLRPLTFLRKMRDPATFAFSTASSGATIPVTLRTVDYSRALYFFAGSGSDLLVERTRASTGRS